VDLSSRPKLHYKYQVKVQFELMPGARKQLIDIAVVHPSAEIDYPDHQVACPRKSYPQLKYERDYRFAILLDRSEEALSLFNRNLISFRRLE
jgi:hypothetical protein